MNSPHLPFPGSLGRKSELVGSEARRAYCNVGRRRHLGPSFISINPESPKGDVRELQYNRISKVSDKLGDYHQNVRITAGYCLGQFTMVQYVEPAVNRQPGFRRELVEQSTHLLSSFYDCPSSRAIQIQNCCISHFILKFPEF